MLRAYSQFPILAVSATIFNKENQILLIQRAKEPAKGLWALPGGAVNLGESPEAAVKRELTEECGIMIEEVLFNRLSSHVFYDQQGRIQYHYIILNYLCDYPKTTINIGSDASGFRWISTGDLSTMALAEGVGITIHEGLKKREGSI